MTFHTQSKNINKVRRDIGRHILNDLNFNSLRDVFIQLSANSLRDVTHTHTHTQICNHVLEGKKNQQKV